MLKTGEVKGSCPCSPWLALTALDQKPSNLKYRLNTLAQTPPQADETRARAGRSRDSRRGPPD